MTSASASTFIDRSRRLLQLAARARNESNAGSRPRELKRDRAPDAATRAGHQRRLALKCRRHAVLVAG
jgi:hypothetical protein